MNIELANQRESKPFSNLDDGEAFLWRGSGDSARESFSNHNFGIKVSESVWVCFDSSSSVSNCSIIDTHGETDHVFPMRIAKIVFAQA